MLRHEIESDGAWLCRALKQSSDATDLLFEPMTFDDEDSEWFNEMTKLSAARMGPPSKANSYKPSTFDYTTLQYAEPEFGTTHLK